ncbi:VanZ family protein [Protaetiibacter intestinalis]|uniref:VanZ family protein n=1 Tax=Protaetiibacter intestinalis TaxID=2419774 RepID=A0A387B672_9MICO|nr:VanZ family protein [Protaetiibacter intestinalis]AYF97251.1 VanZ family protein [Protaetiibacter intestinalis]
MVEGPHPRLHDARLWLAGYAVALAVIGLWPVHVDEGARPLLDAIIRAVPGLSYPRIEFAANVLLFVPMGALLAVILRRRYLVLPIALVVTVGIESAQASLIAHRTPSVLDVIANVTGAAVGLLLVELLEHRRRRTR